MVAGEIDFRTKGFIESYFKLIIPIHSKEFNFRNIILQIISI